MSDEAVKSGRDGKRAVSGADSDGGKLSPEERRRQRARNVAIGLVLGGLFVLFYILTIARLGSNVFNRPL
ncbi:MAG: hypothetical protein ACOYJQ_01770 [Pseudochelatococcus sp.]|uniref:hypothetical protein n=1 Tax=Pseudochelatococcus sp. TaxID=2020869 RepID=UPI003D8BD596